MFIKANKALNDRRAGLKREEGFTLIELLVVVLIIGILAAIAIPVFLGVQDNAKKAAVTSDLTNAKTAIIAYFTDNPTADAIPVGPLTVDLSNWGYTASDLVELSVFAAIDSPSSDFCLDGAHDDIDDGVAFRSVSADGGVEDTLCAA